MENVVRSQWGFECIVAGQDSGSNGVAVLFKNNFEYKVHSVVKDDEDRYILIDIEMLNKLMTIANIYAPSSGDHPEYLEKVIREVVLLDNESIVIGGDYFLVSEHLGLDIAGADIMPGYCFDHSLVYIGFKSDIVKRHRPLSKFNNSLL